MKPPRPSYANVASTLALLIALGTSGAYAASQLAPRSVGERQLRPGAVTADKIRKNAVTAPKVMALAIKNGKIAGGAVSAEKLADGAIGEGKLAGGAVTTAKLGQGAVTGEKVEESSLGQVPSAASADTAAFAESANPAAFARVEGSGSLDGSNSKGVVAVKRVEAGVYCVTASFAPRGAQLTPVFDEVKTVAIFARIGGAGSPCPSPQVEVQAWNGGVKVDTPFFLVAYR
ncbi:MAG: hypothetical protein ACJ75S_12805 [Solirubrobacterales bacterium]